MREPTECEVDRACAAGNYGTGREIMRTMLRAALNPPKDPEIDVTESMYSAAEANGAAGWPSRVIASVYRAMHAVRPKTIESGWCKHDWRSATLAYASDKYLNRPTIYLHYCATCGATEKI